MTVSRVAVGRVRGASPAPWYNTQTGTYESQKEFQMDIGHLFKSGILVQVHVRMWTGQRALTPEDLGLDPNSVSNAFVLGRKYLIDEELIRVFRTLDGQARRIVDENGFSFPIGNARFIPRTRIDTVVEQLEAIKAKFLAAADELVVNYDKHRTDMIPVYREAAVVAFNNQEDSATEFSIEDREAKLAAFTETFLARVATFYPSAATLKAKFDIEHTVFEIAPPSDKTKYASEKWKQSIATQMDTFVHDTVTALRQEALTVVDRVHAALTGGKVHSKTLNSLSDFIAKFKDLNFVGDKTIEEQLEALRKEVLDVYPLDKVKDEPEIQEAIISRLVKIHEAAENVADLGDVVDGYKRRVVWQDEPDTKAA